MTAILSLLLALQSDPLPAAHACESASVQSGDLRLDAPDWAFAVRPETACEPSTGVAALMYSVGIDPIESVQAEELDADIYTEDTP